MADLGIRLLIEAENRSRQELEQIPADVKRLQEQMRGLNQENAQAVRTYESVLAEIRGTSNALKTEMVPALKQTTEATSLLSTAWRLATPFAAGLGSAIGSLAVTLGGQYVESLRKAREQQQAWLDAMSSGNVDKLTAAIRTQTEEVLKLGAAYNDLYQRPRAKIYEQGTVGALESATSQLAQTQRQKEYAEFTRGLEQAEGPGVQAVLGQQEQARLDAIKRAAEATRREAERLRQEEAKRADRIRREQAQLRGQLAGSEYDEGLAYNLTPEEAVAAAEKSVARYRKEVLAQRRDLDLAFVGEDEGEAFKPGTNAGVDRYIRNEVAAMRRLAEEQKRLDDQLREQFERSDAFAGWRRGFDDVAKAAEAAGQNMQDFAARTATSMQYAFSDLFFNVITGQFKNLADVGKQFGLAMARNFSDALAQAASAPILRGLAGLANFFPDSGMSLLNIAPGATQQVSALQRAGYNVGGTTAPPGTTGIPGLYSNLYTTAPAPQAGLPGGGFGVGLGEGEFSTATLGGGAIDYGGLATGVGALGFGLAAANSRGSMGAAMSGASVGFTVGSGIASLLGAGSLAAGGIGFAVAVFGMVAANAIYGATSPTNERPNTGWRALELVPVLNEDVARVKATTTYLDLAEAIRGAMHQAYGGPSSGYWARQTTHRLPKTGRGNSMATAGYAITIAGQLVILPGGSYPATMTLDQFAQLLATDADTFTARLQLGAPESSLREINRNFEDAVKAQAELIGQLNATPIAFRESAPGLDRTTLTVASQLGQFPGARGNQLYADRLYLSRLGWTETQMDAFLRAFSDRNTQSDRFPDLPREVRLML